MLYRIKKFGEAGKVLFTLRTAVKETGSEQLDGLLEQILEKMNEYADYIVKKRVESGNIGRSGCLCVEIFDQEQEGTIQIEIHTSLKWKNEKEIRTGICRFLWDEKKERIIQIQ